MNFKKAFWVSDIHGCYDEFILMLKHWNPKEQLLVLGGDYIDRGQRSYDVLDVVQRLVYDNNGQVIALRGNHENLMIEAQETNNHELWVLNGGNKTLESIEHSVPIVLKEMVRFSKATELYYEFGNVLFVHAGVTRGVKRLDEMAEFDFTWNRDHYKTNNLTGKTIIFGHTPTRTIHNDTKNDDIWISKDGSKIAADGACVFGGQLNGLVVDLDGNILEKHVIKKVGEKDE